MSNDTFAHAVYGWQVEILPEEMSELNAIAEEFADEDPCGNGIQETISELMESDQPGHKQMLEWMSKVSARLAELQGISKFTAKQDPSVLAYLSPYFVSEDCYEGCLVEPGAVVFGFALNCFPFILIPVDPAVNSLLKAMQDAKATWQTWVT